MRIFHHLVARSLFVLVLVLAGTRSLVAQDKFSLTAGWGYYELINAGVQWNFSEKSSLSLYGGTNLRMNETRSWSLGLSFDQTYPKPLFWKVKAGYSVGALYWTSDDELYYFTNIAVPFMALLAYPVSPSVTARVEGGVLFNAILTSDRKQNVEAGFPERVNGNVRLSILYKFGSK